MSWYLRKADQTVYGPVEFEILRRWASDGRIVPDDQVSEDQQTWLQAPGLSSLEMEWLIVLPENRFYGPLHLMALAELVRDGTIVAANEVLHGPTGQRHALCDVLLPPLAEHAAALQDALDARAGTPPETAEAGAEAQARLDEERAARLRAEEALAEAARRSDTSERLLREQVAALERQAEELARRIAAQATDASWRARAEEEHAAREKAEAALAEARRAHEEQAQTLRNQVESLAAHLREAEAKAAAPAPPAASGGPSLAHLDAATLRRSYSDLNRNYERLLEQLRAKQDELTAAGAQREQAETALRDKTLELEAAAAQARAEADELRQRLAGIEETHEDIVRAYRDLNDRHIRLRQQMEAQRQPGPSDGAVPPKDARPDKPRVRLV